MAAFDWEMEAVRWAFMHKRVATKVVCVGAETRAKSDYIFATDGLPRTPYSGLRSDWHLSAMICFDGTNDIIPDLGI